MASRTEFSLRSHFAGPFLMDVRLADSVDMTNQKIAEMRPGDLIHYFFEGESQFNVEIVRVNQYADLAQLIEAESAEKNFPGPTSEKVSQFFSKIFGGNASLKPSSKKSGYYAIEVKKILSKNDLKCPKEKKIDPKYKKPYENNSDRTTDARNRRVNRKQVTFAPLDLVPAEESKDSEAQQPLLPKISQVRRKSRYPKLNLTSS